MPIARHLPTQITTITLLIAFSALFMISLGEGLRYLDGEKDVDVDAVRDLRVFLRTSKRYV
jgi:hypothetical protein